MSSFLPVLSIVGPTATGKSDLAVAVAERAVTEHQVNHVHIISADSRQVYQGMEIVTGADVRENTPQLTFYGTAMTKPSEDWSVAHFQELCSQVAQSTQGQRTLIIIVGGTGLYQTKAFEQDPQLQIPPNEAVRARAEELSLVELQAWLSEVAADKWQAMNQSDRANPRRLVRAIEIKLAEVAQVSPSFNSESSWVVQRAWLGLSLEKDQLEERIAERVLRRFANGAVNEVERLKADYDDWTLPAFSATGIKEVRAYLDGQLDKDQCLELWTRREVQYAKRQLTWWRKYPEVTWFAADQLDQSLLYSTHVVPFFPI